MHVTVLCDAPRQLGTDITDTMHNTCLPSYDMRHDNAALYTALSSGPPGDVLVAFFGDSSGV